ncbi:hypothetical protein Tco_1193474 [Tanacetum coccineum]
MRYSHPPPPPPPRPLEHAITAAVPHLTTDLLGYVPESDPEEDDKDPEEDLADYPADRDDDDDDDEDEDEDEEEEEEHPAPADSVPPVHRMTARISIRDEPSISLPPREEVGEVLAAGAARQDGPAIAREDPYSVARGDLYGFVDMVDVAPGHPMSRELNYGITDTWDDLETTIMYDMMEDAQDDRSLLRARVNLLYRDRPVHRCFADFATSDVMSLHTTVVAQSALILELQSADHRRQGVIKELWASDHKRQVQLTKALQLLKGLQTQMTEFPEEAWTRKGSAQHECTRGGWSFVQVKFATLYPARNALNIVDTPVLRPLPPKAVMQCHGDTKKSDDRTNTAQ